MSEEAKKVIFLPLEMKKERIIINRRGIRNIVGLIAGLAMMILSSSVSAQTLEVGLFGGGSYYLGEMNPAVPFKNTQLAYGAIARYNQDLRWSFRLSYQRGGIKGYDEQTGRLEPQDYSFEAKVNDISLVAEFNFLEYFTGSRRNFFTPYIFGGVGYSILSNVSSEASDSFKNSFVIPFGFGFKYSVSKKIGIGLEWGMRKTFTDYVDGVNSIEYQTGDASLSDAADNWDWYNLFGLSVTYKINLRSKLKCNLDGW